MTCRAGKWLEELASESNILHAREDITEAGTIAGPYPRNYICVFVGVSLISLDECVRVGLRFVWYSNKLLCFSVLQRGHREHPCEKDWEVEISSHDAIFIFV